MPHGTLQSRLRRDSPPFRGAKGKWKTTFSLPPHRPSFIALDNRAARGYLRHRRPASKIQPDKTGWKLTGQRKTLYCIIQTESKKEEFQNVMKYEIRKKESFAVIGKQRSTEDGEGFIGRPRRLWHNKTSPLFFQGEVTDFYESFYQIPLLP